jgi:two-component system OmpR family sensor kinase
MLNAKAIQWRSIRVGLTRVFVLFLSLVMLLGFFSIQELGAVNKVSAEIRDRWLQSTRVLGDLNNYTSDARAAEASRLLARDAGQRAIVDAQIDQLNRTIARSDRDYRQIVHDEDEIRLYGRFARAWGGYNAIAHRVFDLSRHNHADAAAALYMGGSLRAYSVASDALGVLTSRTVIRAAELNNQALSTYNLARALILFVLALAGAGLIAAISYITKHVTGPILNLAARMRLLAANDMSVEIEGANRRDEIGEMARAVEVFRSKAVALIHSRQGLIQQASMLEEKLQAEQALTDLQRNFVSMASHEFRTPLTIIDGHAQRLISTADRASSEQVADRASRIRATVKRMTHLIEHLMNTSKLLDGHVGLYFHPSEVDISHILSEVVTLNRELSPTANIIEDFPKMLTCVADYKLINQAAGNLLSNAIKYSTDGDEVHVRATISSSTVEITVEDHGLGIPKDDLDHIFNRYHRASNVGGIVGTGIGLNLVKIVADLHGGVIVVKSEVGKGSKFTLIFPHKHHSETKSTAL